MALIPNPVAMRGRILRCWLVAYRAPAASVQARLPAGLEAIEHRGWGFYHWVVCEIGALRPAFLPPLFGITYRHAALRILCRARLATGGMQSGLYFLHSTCQAPPGMATAGNLLTDFRFHAAPIRMASRGTATRLEIGGPCPASWTLDPAAPLRDRDQSPFRSVEEAIRCLKYPPHALCPGKADTLRVLSIRRDESHWLSAPVGVLDASCPEMDAAEASLEMAFEVAPIDYEWGRAQRLPLAQI